MAQNSYFRLPIVMRSDDVSGARETAPFCARAHFRGNSGTRRDTVVVVGVGVCVVVVVVVVVVAVAVVAVVAAVVV